MKKGFLFGFGVLLAGGVLAATISTVTIENKSPGDFVSNEEFNLITTGLENLSSAFDGTTSTDTSITVSKSIAAPELCISADCKTAWPTGGTSDNLGNHIATQAIVPSVNNSFDLGSTTSKFANVYAQSVCINNDCQTEWPTGSGTADNLGDHVVLQDLLPEMTGATPLMGNPPGSPSVVSTRNLGSNTQWFSNLWVEDLHVGNQSLYMNGVKVLESDPTVEMRFTADGGQDMSILTTKDITSGETGVMSVKSVDDLNLEVLTNSISKILSIKNNSTNGTIEIATLTGPTSSSQIKIESKNIRIGKDLISKTGINLPSTSTPAYTLDVNGDINFTGTLYENGVAFSGGTGGTTSPWTTATGGITYKAGSVGIGVTTPVTSLDVSGGKVLAEKFCISTPSATDVCTSKTCAASMESGENGSTCFTQATLTALESVLADAGSESGTSYWDNTALGSGIYFNQTGNVGIGTNNPSAKLHVYGGNIKISGSGGTGGDLVAEGSIQVGGHYCPAPGATCTKAGEIASCGAGGQILACAGTSSQWMPITSHNGTVVGTTSDTCSSTNAGTMRFLNGLAQSLQICMKLSGSSTYSWRTIMSGGGTATS